MDLNFLEFEQPIAELEAKIEELRLVGDDAEINIEEEIDRLRAPNSIRLDNSSCSWSSIDWKNLPQRSMIA